jgi:hypothetical protein
MNCTRTVLNNSYLVSDCKCAGAGDSIDAGSAPALMEVAITLII